MGPRSALDAVVKNDSVPLPGLEHWTSISYSSQYTHRTTLSPDSTFCRRKIRRTHIQILLYVQA